MSDETTRKSSTEGSEAASPLEPAEPAEPALLDEGGDLGEEGEEEEESPALSALLKRSLAEPVPPSEDADRELLAKVQSKLRQRSKGKFYADGWSTTQSRVNYALVAVIMLVTIVAVYLALGPMGISH